MNTMMNILCLVSFGVLILGCRDEAKDRGQASQGTNSSALVEPTAVESDPPDFVPVDKEPTVVSKVEPVYPSEDFQSGREGKIWLKVLVAKDGNPRKVMVLKRDGSEAMEKSAVEAAQHFKFTPAQVRSESVSVWVSIPFKFKLAPSGSVKAAK